MDVSQRDILQDDLDSTLLSLSVLTDLATQGVSEAISELHILGAGLGALLVGALSLGVK